MRRAVWRTVRSVNGRSDHQPCRSSSIVGLSDNWFRGSVASISETCSSSPAATFQAHASCSGKSVYHINSRCFSNIAVASQPSGKVIKQQDKLPSKLTTLPTITSPFCCRDTAIAAAMPHSSLHCRACSQPSLAPGRSRGATGKLTCFKHAPQL